jgi:hypothetical protein
VRYGTGWAATAQSFVSRIIANQWHHRLRPAVAVQADNLSSLSGQDAACLRVAVPVTRLIWVRWCQPYHRGQPEPLDDLQRDERLAEVVIGLGDDGSPAFHLIPGF